MTGVSKAVERWILDRPFYQELISIGLINYGALSERMHPDIEADLNDKVAQQAIVMALRRLSERYKTISYDAYKFPKEATISARDNICEVNVRKTPKTLGVLRKLIEKIEYAHGDYVTVTQGVNEILFIVSYSQLAWLKEQFKTNTFVHVRKNLSALSITIPKESVDTPGVFYVLSRNLALAGINIVEVVSTSQELTFVVETKNMAKAYKVIQELVQPN